MKLDIRHGIDGKRVGGPIEVKDVNAALGGAVAKVREGSGAAAKAVEALRFGFKVGAGAASFEVRRISINILPKLEERGKAGGPTRLAASPFSGLGEYGRSPIATAPSEPAHES